MARPRSSAQDLALIATFAGFIAALGLVPAFSPFGFPVPVTIQSLGIMLTGAILGARRGASAVLLFLALVALGLPLLSGGRGGLGVFAGPSAGYLIGFPIAAAVVGWLIHRRGAPYSPVWGFFATVVGGIAVLYSIGIPVTAWRADLSLWAAVTGSSLFVVGDLVKALIAASVAGAVFRARPDLLPVRRSIIDRRAATADAVR